MAIVVIYSLMEKNHRFKADNKHVKFPTQFCLGNISENLDYLQSEEVSFKESVHDFSVDNNAIDKFNILKIHKYLMAK